MGYTEQFIDDIKGSLQGDDIVRMREVGKFQKAHSQSQLGKSIQRQIENIVFLFNLGLVDQGEMEDAIGSMRNEYGRYLNVA